MSAGRCPGCGYTDSSCKRVRNHMRECSGVTSMFQAGEVISDPEVAYRQYREWLKTPEAQAERDEHHARTYAESRDRSEARQEVQRRKWTPP